MASSSISLVNAGATLRVVIADDHILLRQGMVSMLEAQDFDVVGR